MTDGRQPPARLAEETVLLAAFLLSSGRGLLEEPPGYGPARCMDGARRALAALEESGVHDPRLVSVRTRLEEFMCGPMVDTDLTELLDDLCRQLAGALEGHGPPEGDVAT
ncbi:hypothetical protein SUDANB58_00033 [Streptomyces sp. enrichment culture]|uniref:DUF6092 family protein n=1 Tax=Streptomyces sp. enrichment culture TaxID=1795815 RepID=UPI003F558238